MTTLNSINRFLLFWSLLFLGCISPAFSMAGTDYPSIRANILALQAAQLAACPEERQKRCILLGDSLTECFYAPSLAGGYEVFNAGIGSAGVSDLCKIAPKLCSVSGIKVAILCIGINDATQNISFNATEFNRHYIKLCKDIARHVSVLYVNTIFPVEKKKPLGDSYFDPERILIMNNCIRNIANIEGYILIDTFNAFADEEGFMQKGGTVDGVHLTPISYSKWKKLIEDTLVGRIE